MSAALNGRSAHALDQGSNNLKIGTHAKRRRPRGQEHSFEAVEAQEVVTRLTVRSLVFEPSQRRPTDMRLNDDDLGQVGRVPEIKGIDKLIEPPRV
ncbi:hypothetical protein [Kribbella sp. NPDC051620]|uniref:hypothetical protein n=1 Tax=Kribbella sp. NPDC051620 TaxID=3364120 RepID=UPI0037ACFDF7